MKKVAVRVQNNLLAEGILAALGENADFTAFKLQPSKLSDTITDCEALRPDIILMSVSYAPNETMERCLEISSALHERLPKCKTIFLCDENSAPEIAQKAISAKKDGKIDAFFYSSVSGKYLNAVLKTL